MNNAKQWIRVALFGVGSAGLSLLFSALFPALVADWEAKTLDYRLSLRGPIETHPAILLIDADDESIERLGRWPWNRAIHARMIRGLAEAGASAIAYDVVFAQPSNETSDQALLEATQAVGRVYYPVAFDLLEKEHVEMAGSSDRGGRDLLSAFAYPGVFENSAHVILAGRTMVTMPTLMHAAAGIGHIASNRDKDGVIRRVPLVVDVDGHPFPAFGLEVAAGYLSVTPDRIVIQPGRSIVLRDARFPDGTVKNVSLPIDERGMMLINYAGLWAETFSHLTFADVLEEIDRQGAKALSDDVKGRLVLISNAASGYDMKPTPLEAAAPGGGIHANILNTILTEQALRETDPISMALITLAFAVAGARLGMASGGWGGVGLGMGLLGSYLIFTVLALAQWRVALPVMLPSLGLLLTVGTVPVYRLGRARLAIRTLEAEKQKVESHLQQVREELTQQALRVDLLQEELTAMRADMNSAAAQSREQATAIQVLEMQVKEAQAERERSHQAAAELESRLADMVVYVVSSDVPGGTDTALREACARHGIITQDPTMFRLFQQIQRVAPTSTSVLLLGETGTGKELLARAIHALSPRSGKALMVVNVPNLQDTLIESELFGHTKGAFTGATQEKMGKFEVADHGTLFLDEIGEMKLELQAKLLRVLQSGEVDRIGAAKPVVVDVRVIAATNRDLEQEVQQGRFREDLYFRLNVFPITLPSLRDRKGDIPLLATHFLQHSMPDSGTALEGLSDRAMQALSQHEWRGNVRELKAVIERSVVLSQTGLITEQDLGLPLMGRTLTDQPGHGKRHAEGPAPRVDLSGDKAFLAHLRYQQFEIESTARILKVSRGTVTARFKGLCFQALVQHEGNVAKAATALAGDSQAVPRVAARLSEYEQNLVEIVAQYGTPDEAMAECRRRFKNIPQRFFPALEKVVRRHCAEEADGI